jgi:hypothetical protein
MLNLELRAHGTLLTLLQGWQPGVAAAVAWEHQAAFLETVDQEGTPLDRVAAVVDSKERVEMQP